MSRTSTHGGLLIKLLMGAVAMFAFAIFVLPPLYDLF
ncbi:MAG: cytochrome c oxidase assembly protein, partial [Porticoccaceae bacterium]|nr:cytochrome c oxidase assembly protein [Porticoccaceae bacterium]